MKTGLEKSTSVDKFFKQYIDLFLFGNSAGRLLADSLYQSGVGLTPVLDHCTIRTHDVERIGRVVQKFGFEYDRSIGVLNFDSWWAKVFRKPGYPALFIDQAFDGERGEASLIPGWVDEHGDECFHHIAVLVEDIEGAVDALKSRNLEFPSKIIGAPGTDLRQIFTRPEIVNGKAFTVLELIERHNGYQGFLPPQADGLMESSRLP